VTPTAAERADLLVEAAQDDPTRRLELAAAFYARRPGRADVRGYRRAELAFLQWQISRGVLAPVRGDRPGSPWWRAVNAGLLRDAAEADLIAAGVPGTPSRPAVHRWLDFLTDPSPASWYRAHNTSIVAGYVEHRRLGDAESPVERFFLDVTLARVLFVHGLVLNPRLALGRRLRPLGRLGDPRRRGVDVYLSLRDVLPREYPLVEQSITVILDQEDPLGRLIDYGVMLPRMQALYEFAAHDLDEPRLLDFIVDGDPVYAWPHEGREAWRPRKHRRLIALVGRVTPPG